MDGVSNAEPGGTPPRARPADRVWPSAPPPEAGPAGPGTGSPGAAALPRWAGPAAGLAAALAALAVAELVAALVDPHSAPLVAVGGVVVDAVPGGVKEFAIGLFGTHDKLALLVGTATLLGGYSLVVGALAARRLRYGVAGVLLFGLVGVLAALTRAGAGPLYALPALLGTAAAVGVLVLLLRRAVGDLADGPQRSRRRLLAGLGYVAAGAAVLGLGGRWLGVRQGVATARGRVRLPAPASPAPVLPAQDLVRGQTAFVTPSANFYLIDTALSAPQVDPDTWRLKVHGRVGNPFSLGYADLLAMPMIERYVTLACVSNEVGGDLVGNARWLGVPVADLLRRADPLPGADQVVSRSVDGFTAGTPTAALLDGRDAMLAVGMNGSPLPVAHGFPVRMVVPGLYGYVSATKWLAELELRSFGDFDAYWVDRGWAARAPVKTQSRIDVPRQGTKVPAGPVVVAGVAWAQHRGISAVEVRVDDGSWRRAILGGVPSVDTWREWRWNWPATPGRHTLRVRATDNGGATQTSREQPPAPDGATGWHTIDVVVT